MNTKKIDTLLIIRGLLALSVVVWHIGKWNANVPPVLNIPGRTAVWMFFGISGYVIAYGFFSKRYLLTAKELKKFYINRFLRIYPLFLFLSLVALVTAHYAEGQWLIGFSDIPSQLLMLQFNHSYVLSGVFWTLGIEVQFYLLAPLLVALFASKWIIWAGIYFIFVCWVPLAYYFLGYGLDGRNVLSNLSHFYIGMIACKLVLEEKKMQINRPLIVLLILVIIAGTNYLYSNDVRFYWTIGSVAIDLAILLCVVLHNDLSGESYGEKNYVVRIFAFLGLISYGVYGWHPYLTKYIPAMETNTWLAIAGTVTVAFLSYRLLEKPILSLKRKGAKRGRSLQ